MMEQGKYEVWTCCSSKMKQLSEGCLSASQAAAAAAAAGGGGADMLCFKFNEQTKIFDWWGMRRQVLP